MTLGVKRFNKNRITLVDCSNVAASTFTSHLDRLEERGLIELVEPDHEGLERSHPFRFFRLTEAARELFNQNNLFEREVYQALFAEVEKSDEIEAAEAAERPEGRD